MKKKTPKIFIGNTDVASVISELKIVFKEDFGIDTLTLQDERQNNFDKGEVDVALNEIKDWIPYFKPRRISSRIKPRWEKFITEYYFKKALKECDVFIYIWKSFYPDYSDFERIKAAGKKLVVVFCGNDIRWFFSQKQEFNSYGLRHLEFEQYDYSTKGLRSKLDYLRKAEKYADMIFSRTDQAQLALRPYFRWHMMVDTNKIVENSVQRALRPKVAHAPSNRLVKGTKYVLEAFEKLKNEGIEFEPALIEGVKNAEAIKLYQDADILIDQLICPGSGKLATEALASGTIVMGHMAYGIYPQNNPSDYPIVDVNPDTIYLKLKELILDYPQRVKLAKQGRIFVDMVLDYRHFCNKIIKYFNGENVEYDYIPTFFRDKFTPESDNALVMYNEYNRLVENCDWYKKNIQKGTREGLVF
ncbi:MAG: glycosyltransferase [Bacteroidetes bacterium]|nr:glycosyltransferase [Bacteroidota bacterium]